MNKAGEEAIIKLRDALAFGLPITMNYDEIKALIVEHNLSEAREAGLRKEIGFLKARLARYPGESE